MNLGRGRRGGGGVGVMIGMNSGMGRRGGEEGVMIDMNSGMGRRGGGRGDDRDEFV